MNDFGFCIGFVVLLALIWLSISMNYSNQKEAIKKTIVPQNDQELTSAIVGAFFLIIFIAIAMLLLPVLNSMVGGQ